MSKRWTKEEESDLWYYLTIGRDCDFAAGHEDSPRASWKDVSLYMEEQGYNRTPEACRKKWNILEKLKKEEDDRETWTQSVSNLAELTDRLTDVKVATFPEEIFDTKIDYVEPEEVAELGDKTKCYATKDLQDIVILVLILLLVVVMTCCAI